MSAKHLETVKHLETIAAAELLEYEHQALVSNDADPQAMQTFEPRILFQHLAKLLRHFCVQPDGHRSGIQRQLEAGYLHFMRDVTS